MVQPSATRSRPLVFAILLLCHQLAGVAAYGASYHVARNAPGASDNNNGLSPVIAAGGGPWRSLSKAASTARAGDTVLVYDGDYRSEEVGYGTGIIPIKGSGSSASSVIKFTAAVDQQPVLNTLLVHDRQWIEVSGLSFVSPGLVLPSGWRDMPEIVVDDASVVIDPDEDWSTREPKVRQKYATYMGIEDYFNSVYTNGIDIKNSRNIVVRGNTIRRYTFGVQVRGLSQDITIENNEISHCNNAVFTWQPKPALSGGVIRNNVMYQNFSTAIDVREDSQDVIIEGNRVEYSGISHITLINGTSNCTVRGNTAQFGGYYSETMRHPGSTAINVHSSREGIVVEGNFAADQIDLTGNDGNGYIADLMLDGAGVLYRNNVAYRNMGAGINLTVSPNCVMLNNALIENGYDADDPRRGAGINFSRDQDIDQTVLNNIFYNNKAAGIKSFKILDAQKLIDHNLYYASNGAPFIWDGHQFDERAYRALAEIRAASRWESNGRSGDPRFVSLAKRDFRVVVDSPAIDAGKTTTEVADDFVGVTRPKGSAYDIGIFEFDPDERLAAPGNLVVK